MDEQVGSQLHGSDSDARKKAASVMGQSKSDKKLVALANNRANFTGHSEEVKQQLSESQKLRWRLWREARGLPPLAENQIGRRRHLLESAGDSKRNRSEAQRLRRERERLEREASGTQPPEPTVKRPRGRPKKQREEFTSPEGTDSQSALNLRGEVSDSSQREAGGA